MKKILSLMFSVVIAGLLCITALAAEPRRGSECPLCKEMGFHQTLRYEYKDTGSERTCPFCGYTTTVQEVIIHYDGYCTACNQSIVDRDGTKYMEARCPAHGDIM